jgi:hypothetical protein
MLSLLPQSVVVLAVMLAKWPLLLSMAVPLLLAVASLQLLRLLMLLWVLVAEPASWALLAPSLPDGSASSTSPTGRDLPSPCNKEYTKVLSCHVQPLPHERKQYHCLASEHT